RGPGTELRGRVRVEIAVSAAGGAERHVHVEAERALAEPGARAPGQRPRGGYLHANWKRARADFVGQCTKLDTSRAHRTTRPVLKAKGAGLRGQDDAGRVYGRPGGEVANGSGRPSPCGMACPPAPRGRTRSTTARPRRPRNSRQPRSRRPRRPRRTAPLATAP